MRITRRIEARTRDATLIVVMAAVGFFHLATHPLNAGQQPQDPRFDQARKLFAAPEVVGNAEKACDLMKDVVNDHAGVTNFANFQRHYCSEVDLMLKNEQEVYKEGMQAAQNAACDKAQGELGQIIQFKTRDAQYRDRLKQAVADCKSRVAEKTRTEEEANKKKQAQEEDAQWRRCLEAEQAGKYSDAQSCFSQVAQGGGSKAEQARQHLRLVVNLQKEKVAYDEGLHSYDSHDYPLARARFREVKEMKGRLEDEAKRYLTLIDQAEKNSATDYFLRSGLRSYLDSDYTQAERYLTEYLGKGGEKQWLAYFFLGAAHTSQYLISQDKNSQEMRQATDGFREAKNREKQISSRDEIDRVKGVVSPIIWERYATLQ